MRLCRRHGRRWRACAFATCAGVFVGGCAGGMPLMHPAHALAPNQLSAGAGVSGTFLAGKTGAAIEDQQSAPEGSVGDGTAAHAALSPGLAPWLGLRVGLGHALDGGLTYTGRAARADLRHAVSDDSLALNTGLGATALLSRRASHTSYAAVGGIDTGSTTGWGIDVPVLLGARSSDSTVEGWLGPRLGYTRSVTDLTASAPSSGASAADDSPPLEATVNHWSASLVSGIAVGSAPVWVNVELQVGHHWLVGKYELRPGSRENLALRGFSLAPAASLRVEL